MGNRTVMVVEDEPEIRELISDILSCEAYDVQTATNGGDALRQLRDGGRLPDVIVLDVTMPGMDGLTFRFAQLRDPELCHIPVIVASALAPVHELPATRQIQKPFAIDELLDAVSQALGHRGELEAASAA